MKFFLFLNSMLFLLISCSNEKQSQSTVYSTPSPVVQKTSIGENIVRKQCIICHDLTSSHNNRVAPPMIAIKANYLNDNMSKEEFVASLKDFLQKPTLDKAKMRGAVKRFGLMPYHPLTDQHIKEIGIYLYEYRIPEPSWFKEHWLEKNNKPYINSGKLSVYKATKSNYDIGMKYALQTKKVLAKNLMSTIQKKGTLEALKFCNEKAYALTENMSTNLCAQIKRVTDKPRNIENKANQKEKQIIERFKEQIVLGKDPETVVEENNDQVHFYYPILTNNMCLQCHGKPKIEIKEDVLATIAKLYPNDLATGYDVNQVRGIWSIEFEKK